MGGRGSCYLNFDNGNADLGDFDTLPEINEDEKDTEKEYGGKTEQLRKKHIHIKESTDNINSDIMFANAKKFDKMARQYPITSKLLNNNQSQLAVRSGEMDYRDRASFVYTNSSYSKMSIVYNKDMKNISKIDMEKDTQRNITNGIWMKADKNQLVNYTIAHEFGHYIQRSLFELEQQTKQGKERYTKYLTDLRNAKTNTQRKQLSNEYSSEFATKCFKKIQRIHRKHFGDTNLSMISNYGQSSNIEAFAELFAHFNTCKEANTLAKATEMFIQQEFNSKKTLIKTKTTDK